MKLDDIARFIRNTYQVRIGLAVLVAIVFLLPYIEPSIYGVMFGAMIAGLIGLPVLVVYGFIKGMKK